MPPADYSYLDVAVLSEIRERFADADALVVLSVDLGEVIWANGPGAALFGQLDVESMIGSEPGIGPTARRQIMATRGFPAIGSDRRVTIRLTQGMDTRAIGFKASAIEMPDGENAILLVAPGNGDTLSTKAQAADAIGGFTQPGHLVALLDARGEVEASSAGFEPLGISAQALADLARDVSREPDRLVKRIVVANGARLPAGIARLTDNPARHLLMIVDEREFGDGNTSDAAAKPGSEEAGSLRPDGLSASDLAGQISHAGPEDIYAADAAEAVVPEPSEFDRQAPASLEHDASDPSPAANPGDDVIDADLVGRDVTHAAPELDEPEAENAAPGNVAAAGENDDHAPADGVAATIDPATGGDESALIAPEDEIDPSTGTAVVSGATTNEPGNAASPVRFVWRTGPDGRFTALSPEFIEAVGDAAGDVIGRSFADVSEMMRLDSTGEIAGLLERRDTWSGRSVLWPIAGTDLKVPVDLAALPIYSRDRSFEGFRGFGVARMADVVMDPEAVGLRFGSDGTIEAFSAASVGLIEGAEEPAPEPADFTDPFKGEVPALSIVPKPDRRLSDKIIELAEHRTPLPEKSLSPVEKVAFREIGERLKKAEDADRPTKSDAETSDAANQNGRTADKTTAPRAISTELAEVLTAGPPLSSPDEADDPAIHVTPEQTEAKPDSFETEDRTVVPVVEAVETTENDDPDASGIGRETETPDLFEAAQVDELGADAERGAEPYAPSDHEGWSDLTLPAEAAIEAVGDPAPEDVGIPPVETPADSASAETYTEIGRPSADAPAVAAVDEYAPSDHEGWSDRTPPVDVAIEEAEASEPLAADIPAKQDTTILARLPVPILIHSGDILHYANDEFLDLTGHASVASLAAAGGLDALFADAYQDETSDEADRSLRLRTAGGLEFPIEALLRAVPWQGSRALMLVVRRSGDADTPLAPPLLEVGERDELRARLAEMRTIIDTATDGVILIDNGGGIRSISRPAEALFGYESDDLKDKPFVSLFAIESQRAARDYLETLAESGVASLLNDGREVIGREAEGRFIPLFMSIGRLPNDSGYCAVVRDLTQWKRAEEELTHARSLAERASSQKTDFLARISHEIRTPLNAIIGFSELMMDERFGSIGNERYRDYLRDINRSGSHVLDLVNDLLDISKIEAGEQEMAHEAVSLNETLGQSVAMMQPQANRERVIIRSSLASKLPDVVADLRSVRQIALNLLSNAIRYTQAGGQVIVSTSYEPSGDVVMRIRDTGIGMTQAEIEQALKPFKQINALKRTRGDGTGLGLPLTKAMVEANRARFAINSTPGEGTFVEVTFPATRVLAR